MVGRHGVRDVDTRRHLCFERLDCTLKASMLNFLKQETDFCLLRHSFTLLFESMIHFLVLGEKGLKGKCTFALVMQQFLQLVGLGDIPCCVSFPRKVIMEGLH